MIGRREFNLGEIEEGAYYPGVYIIKMNKEFNKEIRYDDFSDEDWRTFIHEYVHFLQDISTRRGYLYFHHKAQLMNLCLYVLQKSGDEVVELPICLEKTGVVNASEKDTLLAFYEGDNAHKKIHHINQVLLEKDEPITDMIFSNSSEKDDLIMINIYYDDNSAPYQFGNICIVESMAYLIEKNLFGAEERCRELPYNACELVCNEIYPELLEYPNRLSYLCEVALMSGNSAQMFYDLLKLCKNSKLANVSDENFIKFCNTNLKAQYSLFEEAYKDAKEGINFLFPSQFPYTLAVNWQLEAYLEGGHNYRIGKGLFISDSFRAVNPKEYFQELISLFAFPMIIDRNGEHYGHNGMQNLPVADAVMDIFLSPERKGCKLQEFCRKSGIVNYDRNVCTNAPWEQCKNEYLCPVAVYFIGYSIDMKKYKWRRYKNETKEELKIELDEDEAFEQEKLLDNYEEAAEKN